MFENRRYCVFNVSELGLIDFSQVHETSAETVRKSVDGTLTFVKWDGENPPACVTQLTTVQPYYTHEEILALMGTPEWTAPMPEPGAE